MASHPTVAEWPFRMRPTVRVRLTLIYGGLFLLAGLALLVVMYLVVRNRLEPAAGTAVRIRTGVPDPGPLMPLDSPVAKQQFVQRVEEAIAAYNSRTMRQMLYYSLGALVLIAVAAIASGWAVAGRVLRPLHEITATARRVADSRLNERIALQGPQDELKELADTFDAMLERLDASFAGQRRFVDSASHELRTPLAINRTLIEVALGDPDASPDLRQLGRTLLATNERSERLIEGLLMLARSGNELTERTPVDLADAAGQALEQTAGEARERGVTVRSRLGGATVNGDGVLLERLALNLVQNGIRHNVAADGWVEVTTTAQDGAALLVVANTGPVVAPYEVAGLFEPFRRLRSERVAGGQGVGLGLSIVRSVAGAHGGTVHAQPREGGGLVVRVAVPGVRRPQGSPHRARVSRDTQPTVT
jgi:signal transduction histidine kinase